MINRWRDKENFIILLRDIAVLALRIGLLDVGFKKELWSPFLTGTREKIRMEREPQFLMRTHPASRGTRPKPTPVTRCNEKRNGLSTTSVQFKGIQGDLSSRSVRRNDTVHLYSLRVHLTDSNSPGLGSTGGTAT